jgi:hypothetical protein
VRHFVTDRCGLWRLGLLGVLAVLALVGAGRAAAATLTVCPSGCEYTAIAAALAAANNGDTIAVGAGTYSGGFTVSVSVRLVGSGEDVTTISGGGPVVTIARAATVTISRVTIRGGTAVLKGGGIDNAGTLTLTRSTVRDNLAGFGIFFGEGGGIFNDGGLLTLRQSSVLENTAQFGAGIRNVAGTVVAIGSSISHNLAPPKFGVGGGGVDNSGALILTNTAIVQNTADGGGDTANGGGIWNESGSAARLKNSRVSGNTATAYNIAAAGGGIANDGTMTLTDTEVSSNTAESDAGDAAGGGIESSGSLTLMGSLVTANKVIGFFASGGGIDTGGTMTLTRTPVFANTVRAVGLDARGGGITNRGDLTLITSPVTTNVAVALPDFGGTANGGGIFNVVSQFLTLIKSPVEGNTPDDCVGC